MAGPKGKTTRSPKLSKSRTSTSKSKSTPKPSKSTPSSSRKNAPKRAPPQQQKTKRPSYQSVRSKKSQRTYTEKELGLPKLNTIVPAGVQKPRGKKQGKVFVDDPRSMMAILAVVNAEKEGAIESKILKMREMEAVREARRQEQERREQERRGVVEDKMDKIRKGKKRGKKERSKMVNGADEVDADVEKEVMAKTKKKKKVSFG